MHGGACRLAFEGPLLAPAQASTFERRSVIGATAVVREQRSRMRPVAGAVNRLTKAANICSHAKRVWGRELRLARAENARMDGKTTPRLCEPPARTAFAPTAPRRCLEKSHRRGDGGRGAPPLDAADAGDGRYHPSVDERPHSPVRTPDRSWRPDVCWLQVPGAWCECNVQRSLGRARCRGIEPITSRNLAAIL